MLDTEVRALGQVSNIDDSYFGKLIIAESLLEDVKQLICAIVQ